MRSERRPIRRGPIPWSMALGGIALALLVAGPLGTVRAAAPAGTAASGGSGATSSLPLFEIRGVVQDQYSGVPIANATVRSLGQSLVWDNTTTDAHGHFEIRAALGTVYLTVDPPDGYEGLQTHLTVANGTNPTVTLGLVPVGLLDRVAGAPDALWTAGTIVAVLGAVGGFAVAQVRRRSAEHRSETLLSPFGWYVTGRVLLIPFQILALLVVLYIFGTFLPALAQADLNGCLPMASGGCAPCAASQLTCQVPVFAGGFLTFAGSLLTGNWGLATIGFLKLPAITFIQWWLPYSIELAAFALLLSIVIGYPLGLAAGWREDGPLDQGLRGTSLALLLLPTFLVVLFVLTVVYTPWTQTFGDSPYNLLPGPMWIQAHGGALPWIGVGGQTSPTGFPILDGALHGDWAFVAAVSAKNLVQAFVIATIYVAIFFRYARQAVAGAARSASLRAARSRGVPESTLLWKHTGRRALPIYLLTFGMTLPAYLGTQAVVEVLFNDSTGLGTILFSEMMSVGQTGIGFHHLGPVEYGNLYQVVILFLAVFLLIGNLCADVLARYLDPTLSKEVRR